MWDFSRKRPWRSWTLANLGTHRPNPRPVSAVRIWNRVYVRTSIITSNPDRHIYRCAIDWEDWISIYQIRCFVEDQIFCYIGYLLAAGRVRQLLPLTQFLRMVSSVSLNLRRALPLVFSPPNHSAIWLNKAELLRLLTEKIPSSLPLSHTVRTSLFGASGCSWISQG